MDVIPRKPRAMSTTVKLKIRLPIPNMTSYLQDAHPPVIIAAGGVNEREDGGGVQECWTG